VKIGIKEEGKKNLFAGKETPKCGRLRRKEKGGQSTNGERGER